MPLIQISQTPGLSDRVKNETIAVIGGGDAAVEEADYLTRYAQKVYVSAPVGP